MAWHPFRNLGLKVVALILGALLWFTVSGQQAERTVPGVAVVYRSKPPGVEITNQTDVVDIHVRGLDHQLRTIQARDFEARVDLTGARPGTQSFSLRTDQVSAPFGIDVTRVEPGSVMAVLEVAGSANLPVRPFVDGTPAQGFVVSEVTVEPVAVTVLGPARRVAAASAATTDRVSIEGAAGTVTQTVSVGVGDPVLRLREPTTARVVVKIEAAGERMFPSTRVAIRNLTAGLRATAEPAIVSVLLRGAQSLLTRIDPATIAPYVDVTGLGPGRHPVPVVLDPRGTLTDAVIRPATVTVIIN